MSTRDLVLLSTFVNILILGVIFLLSKGEEANLPPSIEKQIAAIAAIPTDLSFPIPIEIAALEEPVVEPPPPPQEEWYTMKSGDNPWKVAKSHKIKFDALLKLNQLSEEKARNLKPGDQIRIR